MPTESVNHFLFYSFLGAIAIILVLRIASALYAGTINNCLKQAFKSLNNFGLGSASIVRTQFMNIVERLENAKETNSLRMAKALGGLAEATRRDGMFSSVIIDNEKVDLALDLFRRSADMYRQLAGEKDQRTIDADYHLGLILAVKENYDEAKLILESVLKRGDEETQSRARRKLCSVYFNLNQFELARDTAQQVIDGFSENHFFTSLFVRDLPVELILTGSLTALKQHHEAEKILSELIDEQRKMIKAWQSDGLTGEHYNDLRLLLFNRGNTWLFLGDPERAREDFEELLRLSLESGSCSGSQKNPAFGEKVIHWAENCATSYLDRKTFDPAFDPYKWLLLQQTGSGQAQAPKSDLRTVPTITARTLFLLKLGQEALALTQLRAGVAIEEETGQPGEAHQLFLQLLLKQGELERAREVSDKLLSRALNGDISQPENKESED